MADEAKTSRANRTGFTLIEILVVVAIIGLLMAILIPSLAGAKKNAKIAASKAQLHGLSLACEAYATNNNGQYPSPVDENSWRRATNPTNHVSSSQMLLVSLTRAFWSPVGSVPATVTAVTIPGSLNMAVCTDPAYRPIDHSTNRSYDSYLSPKPTEISSNYFGGSVTTAANLYTVPCFVDASFNNPMPILYFRAKRKYDTSVPNMVTVRPNLSVAATAGFYSDANYYFTQAGNVQPAGINPAFRGVDAAGGGDMISYINDANGGLTNDLFDSVGGNPVAKGAYVLVSPGPDGKYNFVNNKSDNIVQAGGF